MSENLPEPAMNGHGASIAGSAPWTESVANTRPAAAEHAPTEIDRPPTMIDDLCRLTLCGPDRSVELAVPVHVPLIDLLPALVGHLGDGLPDAGLEHGGWVLQRIGDPPLREDLSVAVLGLHDGDVVHLRPRADQLPPLDFDDLIDGIAVGISGRPDRWRPEMSRALLTAMLALPLAAALAVLAGHLTPLSALAAAALAVVLLGLTAAAVRAYADRPVAGVLGAAAICYAGLAAAELPLLHGGLSEGWLVSHPLITAVTLRPTLLVAGAAMAGAAAVVSMVRGDRAPVLVGVLVVALFMATAGALATFGGLSQAEVAGIVVALIVPVSCWVPMLSFRMTGMRLDPPPSTPDELQENLDPLPGQRVLDQTRRADSYMSALYYGLAVPLTCCLVVLGRTGSLAAGVVAVDLIVLLLLHARVLVAARHRLAAVVPAVTGATVLAAAAGLRADGQLWPLVAAALAVTAGLVLVAERSLPGHRMLPHWGRAGDLLHTLTAAGLIPAVAWLLNLYEYARTVRG
jgi:type VII secretion integral membrane protein EccD